MPKSKIVKSGSVFLLEIDGKRMPMYGYMSYQPAKADYEGFRKAGVHLFFTGVYAGDRGINPESGLRPFRPGFWKGYGEYDFSAVDEDFHIILDGGKKGGDYLIPRLMAEPPSWWEADNPGELCRDAQGTPVHQSYQSKKWREDTRRMLFDFQKWLNSSGWADFVPGWHIACGSTEEFMRPRQHPMQFTDYSEPAREAFAGWAREKYGDTEALRRAWHREYASFAEIGIPTPADRMFCADGALRSREHEQYVIDYYRFLNESHAQAAIDLCAMAKEATGGEQVIGAFYGYCGPEFGHCATNMVLRSPAVDFLASPFTYIDNRGQGVDWAFPGSVESAALHGKPWFMEADVRTCLSQPISLCMPFADPPVSRAYDGPVWLGPKDIAGSLGQMKKAFARILTHNTAVWWFDMWGGWYRSAQFMAFHEQACRLYREHAERGGSENAAPIALFRDDEASALGGGGGEMSRNLGHVGTPYRMYMMDDFPSVDPGRFRMAIFSPVAHWTQERKRALENWKRGGRILAFTGMLDYSAVSGVKTRECSCECGFPAGGQRAADIRFDAQAGDVVLSRAADGGAVELLRRMADYSVYVTARADLTAERARQLTAAAGGQVYTFDGDIAYASGEYVAIHAASEGIKRVCVPLRAKLTDVFTGETLPGNETYVDIAMKFVETRILRIEPMK